MKPEPTKQQINDAKYWAEAGLATGRIKIETEVTLGIDVAAKWFAGLNDDEQAKFFVAVCAHMQDVRPMQRETQWIALGSHLATCECSTEDAREMIRSIIYGMEHPVHTDFEPIDLREKAMTDPECPNRAEHGMPETDLVKISEREVLEAAKAWAVIWRDFPPAPSSDYWAWRAQFSRSESHLLAAVSLLETREQIWGAQQERGAAA